MLEVWNKTDLLKGPEREARETEAARRDRVHAISALTGTGLEALLAEVAGLVEWPVVLMGPETLASRIALAMRPALKGTMAPLRLTTCVSLVMAYGE